MTVFRPIALSWSVTNLRELNSWPVFRAKSDRGSETGDSDNNNNNNEDGGDEAEEDDEYDDEYVPEWHEDYDEEEIDEDDFFSDDDESENLDRDFVPYDWINNEWPVTVPKKKESEDASASVLEVKPML